MEFRILGPLEVVDDGRAVDLGGPKQRALLALLLLHANEVVSPDVLADALWEGQPPPAAAKTLQAYVSRLRKALGRDVLETRGHGYLLRVAQGELDAQACRELLEDARTSLADGDAETSAEQAREALGRWRGAPLADVAYESFAQAEVRHLEELRVAAHEEWLEAELALGRHADVVAELKALVRRHPLRERLLGQLMLALYRCDRQAEALDAYQQGRRALAEELGLEPSARLQRLERQILEHDAELVAPPRRGRPRIVPAPAWRHPRIVIALGALLLAAAVTAGIVQFIDGRDASRLRLARNALLALDSGSGTAAAAAIEAPAAPAALAVGFGYVWAASADGNRVVVVDPDTNTVRDTIEIESAAGGIAIAGGSVWVTNSLAGTISQLSPQTLSVVQTIRVGNGPTGIAAGNQYVWVANTIDHTVSKLRATDGKRLGIYPAGPDPGAIAVGEDAVWVASKLRSAIVKLSPATGQVLDRIPVGDGPAAIAVGAGSVWVANSLSGTVSRLDPRTGDVRGTFEIGDGADALAVTPGGIWVAGGHAGSVSRINPRTGRITTIHVAVGRPSAVAAAGDRVYVGLRPSRAAHVGGTLRLLAPDGTLPLPALDPASAYVPEAWPILALTNDGLVGWRRAGGQAGSELVPNLAVSLPSVSDDRRTYTFQLRRGIRYSDGRLLKASDVRFSIERVYKLKPRLEPGAVEAFRAIRGAAVCTEQPARCDLSRGIVTDDRAGTVLFRLARPDPDFLFKLTTPFAYVVPAGTTLHRVVRKPLPSTGPYRLASAARGGSLRLVRNPRFREWSVAAQPAGFVDEILIRPVSDERRAARVVAQGRADVLSALGAALPVPLSQRPQLHVEPTAGTFYLALDMTRPPFDDVRARRAVNYAVDRNTFVRFLRAAAARPTCQVLPPNFPGYKPYCPYSLNPGAASGSTAPDVAKARALITASATAGARVDVWWSSSFGERAGRYLERVLDSLGYRARLRLFSDEGDYFNALLAPGASWHAGGLAWFADLPGASNFVNLFSCSASFNLGRFCDPAVDARIRRALRLQERDPAAANESWAALDRDLTDRAPWLFLYTPYSADFVSKRVGNYQHHPLWGTILEQLWVR